MVEGNENIELSLLSRGEVKCKGKQDTGPECGKGSGLCPHLSRDLMLVIMRKVLELSKNIFSSGEGLRPVAASLLPIFPT